MSSENTHEHEKHCQLCGMLTNVNQLDIDGLCKICSDIILLEISIENILPDDEDYEEDDILLDYLDYIPEEDYEGDDYD